MATWSAPGFAADGDKLVYVLTLLGRSGKVITATVDAANGEPVSAR